CEGKAPEYGALQTLCEFLNMRLWVRFWGGDAPSLFMSLPHFCNRLTCERKAPECGALQTLRELLSARISVRFWSPDTSALFMTLHSQRGFPLKPPRRQRC